ncbi:MAG: hypothetical protein ABFR75_05680 [Acidobacteriota bacterium]
MKILNIDPSELKTDKKFLISNPVRTDRHFKFEKKYPGIPPVIINNKKVVIGGEDSFFYLREKNEFVNVTKTDLDDKDSLFLAYNLRKNIEDLNLWEKLNFLNNILPLSCKEEIYEKTGIEIKINDELKKFLPELLKKKFEELLINERISVPSAQILCNYNQADGEKLLFLFSKVPFSSSFQHNILEIVEEIVFRDKCSVEDIFNRTGIRDLVEQEKPQRDIMSVLSQLRFPEYSAKEEEWMNLKKDLHLPTGYSVSHYPYFEKKGVELKVVFDTPDSLKKGLKKLKS